MTPSSVVTIKYLELNVNMTQVIALLWSIISYLKGVIFGVNGQLMSAILPLEKPRAIILNDLLKVMQVALRFTHDELIVSALKEES